MSPPRTHYDALGVARTATAEEVRAAYRAAARNHHPDAGGDPGRMRDVNAAWRVLGDPVRRAAYDRELAGGSGGSPAADDPWPRGDRRSGAGHWAPGGEGWVPGVGDAALSADEWAELVDDQPIAQTMALEGWWAILPPGTLLSAVGLLVGGFVFVSPVLLALSAGAFVLALGLFVLAPLRAMTKR